MTIQFDRNNSQPADFLEKCGNIALYSFRINSGSRVEVKNAKEYALKPDMELPVWARVSLLALTVVFFCNSYNWVHLYQILCNLSKCF